MRHSESRESCRVICAGCPILCEAKGGGSLPIFPESAPTLSPRKDGAPMHPRRLDDRRRSDENPETGRVRCVRNDTECMLWLTRATGNASVIFPLANRRGSWTPLRTTRSSNPCGSPEPPRPRNHLHLRTRNSCYPTTQEITTEIGQHVQGRYSSQPDGSIFDALLAHFSVSVSNDRTYYLEYYKSTRYFNKKSKFLKCRLVAFRLAGIEGRAERRAPVARLIKRS